MYRYLRLANKILNLSVIISILLTSTPVPMSTTVRAAQPASIDVSSPAFLPTTYRSMPPRVSDPLPRPVYGLVAHYLLAYWPRHVQMALALVVAGVYLYGDFPFFLWNTDWRWFL